MASGAQASPMPVVQAHRARSVWLTLVLACLGFMTLCGAGAFGAATYLGSVTTPQSALLEPRPGTQVTVRRHRTRTLELVTAATTLNEDDLVSTGANGGAFIELFDGSTVQTYFSTTLDVRLLRTSRFFQSFKEVGLHLESGTAVIATAEQNGYSGARYRLTTDHAEVLLGSQSRVRISMESRNGQQMTHLVVYHGSVTLQSRGDTIELPPGKMAWASSNAPPQGPLDAEEDLIRNGYFQEPPTSGAETVENGGLGTAAWLPIRDEPDDPGPDQTITGTVEIVTEMFPSLGTVKAAMFHREGDTDSYARYGIHQEINKPAEFLKSIELFATVRVLHQSEPVGGPQRNVYPLTVAVNYSDTEGERHEWKQHFYYVSGRPSEQGQVPQGTWWSPPTRFVIKSGDVGGDIAVINYIEVYAYGREFQSWITGISMLAR